MKAIFNRLFLFLAASLLFVSCEKDETKVVATGGTSPQLTVTQSKQVLTEAQKNDTAVVFSWTKPDFGYSAAVSYSIQFAKKGTNFTPAKTVYLSNVQRKGYTVAEMNAIAAEIGLAAFTAGEMEVRVSGEISAEIAAVTSNTATVNITPYLSEPEYQVIFMVGDATEGGWDNAKGTAMFRDDNDAFIYTFTGRFKAGNLKFLGISGKWAPQWGANAQGGVAFRAKDADPDPGSFSVPADGYYTVILNIRNNVFSITPFDASATTSYSSIGTIGDFNSWSDIAPMSSSSFNPHFWHSKQTFGASTGLKFRIASGWSVNWGPAKGHETELRGKGVAGGENLTVPAGTYQVYFDDITGHYVFVKE
ncbi:uncharacterized protein DUF5019 [Arcticibacter tournemirensis]|uniref:SusF/SusE family outer membrane protein n=1 Tax=Arcticibacter tournemirensis TaxID=699437 RepID=A0A5M9HGC9_9SPHI|nr:SusE domain-containing protein [Arcticibacter tournemirensis]KAA8484358.1 SusF/SusE family outer membrane protein [Arcticibacter tournemirensis]TQM49795.1 uncharacterized protein DUF5019 [Arcticibacter tournemirensis]